MTVLKGNCLQMAKMQCETAKNEGDMAGGRLFGPKKGRYDGEVLNFKNK